MNTKHEKLVFSDNCFGADCLAITELGLHDSMLELRSASASVLREVGLRNATYEKAGGFYVETLAETLKDSFEESIDLYDSHST
jgi:hypothetical protein